MLVLSSDPKYCFGEVQTGKIQAVLWVRSSSGTGDIQAWSTALIPLNLGLA